MSKTPTFSVLLPAKGRPLLTRDALSSVLEQSFGDFEVIVSNNGAEAVVRNQIADLLEDPRVRYFEQPEVLSMPEHWEKLSRLARGRFLTVVPDRSVLKQGALATIAALHAEGGADAEIVSWSWDLYFDEVGHLEPFAGNAKTPTVMNSEETALASLRVGGSYPSALPRGLNSSVVMSLVEEIRVRAGSAFASINPDFSFAYACLLSRPRFTHLNRALAISQGMAVSNGGNAYRTDATAYLATLKLPNPFAYAPVKAPFVENVIAEDFLAACHRFDRLDLLKRLDWPDYYLKCLAELDEKRAANLLSAEQLDILADAVETALARESPAVRKSVQSARVKSGGLKRWAIGRMKRLFGARVVLFRPLLVRMRGGARYSSIQEASGHSLK